MGCLKGKCKCGIFSGFSRFSGAFVDQPKIVDDPVNNSIAGADNESETTNDGSIALNNDDKISSSLRISMVDGFEANDEHEVVDLDRPWEELKYRDSISSVESNDGTDSGCSCAFSKLQYCLLNRNKERMDSLETDESEQSEMESKDSDMESGAGYTKVVLLRTIDGSESQVGITSSSTLQANEALPVDSSVTKDALEDEKPGILEARNEVVNRRTMAIENATKCLTNECTVLEGCKVDDDNCVVLDPVKVGSHEGPVADCAMDLDKVEHSIDATSLEEETLSIIREVESLGSKELVSSLVLQFEKLSRERRELQNKLNECKHRELV
ncbi:hypothetical protein BEWA_037250 [Theileria equi strain WA]|uniref:Uncharacterized protein n=1 Tax=Theileria equi strain WA TaxID=1537102 RepID=L1LEH9_THEEQ|nr:hypothetical protein BEWA_037250 [Theileria equi strain WA]EKX73689.1 hypothetical protein BEWA_037250 [Theileria equi strain WA]|eukprot:XP_004833141.1 hypothetical protein BEWA_037250 [Theileria equi strain WA]